MSESSGSVADICKVKGAMSVPSATPLLFSLLDKRDWDRVNQTDSPRLFLPLDEIISPKSSSSRISPLVSPSSSPSDSPSPSPGRGHGLPHGVTQAQLNHILKATSAPLALPRNKSESNLNSALFGSRDPFVPPMGGSGGSARSKHDAQRRSARVKGSEVLPMGETSSILDDEAVGSEVKIRNSSPTISDPSLAAHMASSVPNVHFSGNIADCMDQTSDLDSGAFSADEDVDGDASVDFFAQAAAGENFKFYAETYGKMLVEKILLQTEPVSAMRYQSYLFEVANVPLDTYAAAVCPHSKIIDSLKEMHSLMKDYQPIRSDISASSDCANYTALMTFLGQRIKISFTSDIVFPTNKSTSEVRLSRLMASSSSSSSSFSSCPTITSLFEQAYGEQGVGHRKELKMLHVSYITLKKDPIGLDDFLNKVIIPSWSEHLKEEYKLSHLTAAAHREGIRFRDLGKVYGCVKSEKVRRLLIVEMVARTAKWDIISRMNHINQTSGHWPAMKITEFKKIVAEQLNLLFGGADLDYWRRTAETIYNNFSLDRSILPPMELRRIFFNSTPSSNPCSCNPTPTPSSTPSPTPSSTPNPNAGCDEEKIPDQVKRDLVAERRGSMLGETLCQSEEEMHDPEAARSLALLLERLRLHLGIKFSKFIKKRYSVESPHPVRSHNPFNTSHILGFKPVIKMPSVFEFTKAQAILKTLARYNAIHKEQKRLQRSGFEEFDPFNSREPLVSLDDRHKLLMLHVARSCIERALRSDPLNDLFLLRNVDVLEMMEKLTVDPQQKADLQRSIKVCLETSIKFLSSDGLRRYKRTFKNCQRSQFIDFFIDHMDESLFL